MCFVGVISKVSLLSFADKMGMSKHSKLKDDYQKKVIPFSIKLC